MKITGAFIPALPFLWLLIPLMPTKTLSVVLIIFLEIYSGLIWSGFNLSAGNFIYDAVSKERLPICSSYFNIINGFWALIGASIGGYLSSRGVSIFGWNSILFLFIISGVVRFVVYFTLAHRVKEVREVKFFSAGKFMSEKLRAIKNDIHSVYGKLLSKSVSLGRFFESMVSESEHSFSSNPNNFVKNN
jgi:MFS family permease